MAGSIRVAGHTIAEHDIVNDKVDIQNATLGNSVKFTDEYYLQGKVQSNFTSFANNSQINFDGSTAPYWTFTGDTTNFVQGDSISDLKIIKSGIYLIVVNISARLPSPDSERSMSVLLRGVGTGSTSVISGSSGQVIAADGNQASGNATASAIRKFNANDQINIYLESTSDGNIDLHQESHFSICLIRPL